ncbi:MAG: xanthine dehydrogenase family protein molybdopterin-binding subunit [Alphaproteobacteria bacterium]|nr:xanthine dehydrogenase family protein molybdopterin-binding subunit [Alphaproteobacteria bacterium]
MNSPTQFPAGTAFGSIGHPIRRKEDARLLTGKGRYTDDFSIDRQTFAAMVRTPRPHARIVKIHTAAAKQMPGVLLVLTGEDCKADNLKPMPHSPVPSTDFDMKLTAKGGKPIFAGRHMLLPVDKVRYVGEPVAMVVAETRAQAMDAAEAVEVEYDELPYLVETGKALDPGHAPLWEETPDNVLVDSSFGDMEATDRAFAKAAHVIKSRYNIGRVTAVTMELRSCVGDFDAETGRYTLYCGGGGAVKQKAEMAGFLNIPAEKVRVLSYDIGGNFGSRNRPYVEYGLVVWAAGKIKRPVKYTATRSEAFLTDYQGRDLLVDIEAAFDESGKILALRSDNLSNVGSHCVSLSPLSKGSGLITGSYDIPAVTLRSRAVFTNTMPTNAYRSSGRPEVTFVIERLMDKAANQLGIDRIKLRRKNLVKPKKMPYRNAVGMLYDSGTYEANMDLAMKIADWDGFKQRKKAAKKRGKLLGLGMANYVESSIGAPKERTEITVQPSGVVDVVIGTQPSGQGHETSFAQVVADLIAVPHAVINIIIGDTDIVSVGGGSHSGRSMRHAGTVIVKAVPELIDKGRKITALVLQTAADKVEFKDGRFSSPASNRSFDFLELAKEAAQLKLPLELKDGLSVGFTNEMHEPVFPNGCAICEIEVDPDTGQPTITRYAAVDDVGRCINPMIVHGQTHGGIAQGVGQALWEQCFVDPSSGQPLTGSFMDYGMPHAQTLPSFKTEIVEVLSPTNPLGIKAGGEGGTTPALAVVVNAIVDALKDYGIHDILMPATPYAIWQAIEDAKNKGTAVVPGASPASGRNA